jgi:hypothetical protein
MKDGLVLSPEEDHDVGGVNRGGLHPDDNLVGGRNGHWHVLKPQT